MKCDVLISGSTVYGGYPSLLGKGFSKIGWHVNYFDDVLKFYEANKYAKNKYLYRMLWPIMAKAVQVKLINEIELKKPSILLIIKGFYYSPETLEKIKSCYPNIILIYFNPDNIFNTWHFGNSNKWIRSSIKLYDIHLTWGEFLVNEFLKLGVERAYHLPFASDSDLHQPYRGNCENLDQYKCDVSFVGSWDEEREWWLSQIPDYDLKIWGNGWSKANRKLRKKWQNIAVFGGEFSRVCRASKINLNFIRKQNLPAHNMRTFEIPACGGFMLSTRTSEQNSIWVEDEEIGCFSSPKELRQKLDLYLANDQLREIMTYRTQDKARSYSYTERARQIEAICLNCTHLSIID